MGAGNRLARRLMSASRPRLATLQNRWLVDCRIADHAEVNGANIGVVVGEFVPGVHGIFLRMYAQAGGEIVSTAGGHEQHGNLKFRQARKMAMNGAIAAEDEYGVEVVGNLGGPLGRHHLLKRASFVR